MKHPLFTAQQLWPATNPLTATPAFCPVVLSEQIQPGTFEFALDHLVDHDSSKRINLFAIDGNRVFAQPR